MFEVSGLELAEYICRTSPDTVIVFLSGYKEFDYAREAIKNNVSYYLLKPVKNEEIRDVLISIRKRLDAEKINQTKIKQFDEIVTQRRENFFFDFLFCGLKDKDECKAKFEELEFPLSCEEICCTILKIKILNDIGDKWIYGKEGFRTAINNYFQVYNEHAIYNLFLDSERCLVLSENLGIDNDDYAKQLKEWLCSFCKVSAEVETECVSHGIYDLCQHFTVNERDEKIQENAWINAGKYRLLNTYITLNMIEDAKKLFRSILYEHKLDSYSSSVMEIKEMCEKITCNGKNIDAQKYVEMLKYNLEENNYSEAVQSIFIRLAEDVHAANGNGNVLIAKIKEYIHENYANDITLDEVAGQVFLNSVYLSRFFKQHVGESFRDYLLSVRIVNSIKLLESGKYKVYEIAKMVGYESSRYFSKQFKNYTGYTPKAYFRNIWKRDMYE